MTYVKRKNRASILELLYSHGGLSRKDIASRLGLTPAAITLITNDMIKEGLLEETGEELNSSGVGRKEVIIDIKYSKFCAIGININIDQTKIVCIDLKGKVLFEHHFNTSEFNTPENLVKYSCSIIRSYIKKTLEIEKKQIVSVGVGVRGIVDNKNGISLESFGMWNKNVEVKRMFEEEIQMPVKVDNNVRSIARGQLFYSEKNLNSMLLVKFGPGIGGALAVGEKLFTGYNYRAVELGHVIVDRYGLPCRCGRCGCLETIASYEAIERSIQAVYSKELTPNLYKLTRGNIPGFDIDIIMEAYNNGDIAIRYIISRVMYYLALTIKNAITLYDPEMIVLYGEVFENKDFLELLYDFILDSSYYKDIKEMIVKSEFNGELDTKGPAFLAIEHFLSNGGIISNESEEISV